VALLLAVPLVLLAMKLKGAYIPMGWQPVEALDTWRFMFTRSKTV